jgi:hypothetical protein
MPDGDEELAQPREAFALLGHDLRLEILLALLDRWEAAHTEPRRYSELMRAVGLQDSGKFNYHLGKLRGAYLRKTDDGYVPTASATALYRAVLAHRPTETPTRSELDPGVDCPDCGGGLAAGYEREFFTLRCPACEGLVGEFTYPFPKNGLEGRTDREVLRAVYDRARAQIGLARRGQCPDCAGTTTVRLRSPGDPSGAEPPVEIACDTCTWTVRTGMLLPLVTDPQVVRVLSAVGIAVEDAFPWELPDPATTGPDGSGRVDLRFEAEGGVAIVSVDQRLEVLAATVEDDRTGATPE